MRARMALNSQGVKLELREVLLRDKPPSMLDLSPKGTVPVLQTDEGQVIDVLAVVKTAEDCCDTSTKDNGPKAAKNKNLKYVVGETPVDDTSAAIRTQLKIDGHTGLTCHVCRKGGKLVRMCACSGKNGFAHIACLEKKAAKSVEDAVNKRGPRVPHSEQSWARWNACPLCGAEYVGQLSNALGWACWRTYCRRTDEADWQLRFDTLTAVMLIVVTGVSSCVHIYSVGYMHHDKAIARFMAYLSLFTFAMLMLVTADLSLIHI